LPSLDLLKKLHDFQVLNLIGTYLLIFQNYDDEKAAGFSEFESNSLKINKLVLEVIFSIQYAFKFKYFNR